MRISAALRRAVWERAGGCCEYCLISEEDSLTPHEPDHTIAVQHPGSTALENLALACYDCNRPKGPNIASVDPETGKSVFLFNPRRDVWAKHFRVEPGRIVGLTPIGRATASLLQFNTAKRLRLRMELQQAGRYPLFKTWLLQVTRSRILNQLRSKKRRHEIQDIGEEATSRTSLIERVPDPAGDSLERLWDEEWEKNLMDAAIGRVKRRADVEQFQIFDLYVLKNWPVKKVAKTLGISIGQVYLAKHRVSKMIKKEIAALEAKGM